MLDKKMIRKILLDGIQSLRMYFYMCIYICLELGKYVVRCLLRHHLIVFIVAYYFVFFKSSCFFDFVLGIINGAGHIYSFYSPNYSIIDEKLIINKFCLYSAFFFMDDNYAQRLLSIITKITIAGLPISLTFYYFIYREQKATSESALIRNKSRYLAIFFMFYLAFSSLYSFHVFNLFNNPIASEDNFGKILYYADKIMIIFLNCIILLIFGSSIVKKLFQNINIEWLLNNSIQETKNLLERLKYISLSKKPQFIHELIYNDLIYLNESVYQMLIHTVEKNINKTYDQNYAKWVKVIEKLQYGKMITRAGININLYWHLFQADKEHYCKLYSSILRNHFLLIVNLYNKNRLREGHLCLRGFLAMNPQMEKIQRKTYNDDSLTVEFFAVLFELASFFYKNKDIGLHPFMEQIDLILKGKTNIENVVIIYKGLLAKAVYEDNVKGLTELTHAMYKATKVSTSHDSSADDFNPASIKTQDQELLSAMKNKLNRNIDVQEQKNKGLCLYVLLQALMKTIELSHYASTGYLVKYIVTNFDSDLLNLVYQQLISNDLTDDKKLNGRKLSGKIDVSFGINQQTANYCMQKMTILIYAQQKFVKEQKVQVGSVPENYIDTQILQCDHLDYLMLKISTVDKYGLLFLKQPNFMDAVKAAICLKNNVGQSVGQ